MLQVRPAALPRVTNLFGQPKGVLTISQNEISSPQMEETMGCLDVSLLLLTASPCSPTRCHTISVSTLAVSSNFASYLPGSRRLHGRNPDDTTYATTFLDGGLTPSPQVLLNLAASHTSSHAVRDAGIAMVLQSLIHSVTQVRPPLCLCACIQVVCMSCECEHANPVCHL